MLDSFLLVASTLSIATLLVTLALIREVRWRRALQKLVSRLLAQLRGGGRNRRLCWAAWACTLGLVCGCESQDDRLVQLSEQSSARQAEQNRQIARQSQEVTSAVHDLVAADAKARDDLLKAQKSLQHDIQVERARLDARRSQLDRDAADLAAAEQREPLIAAAITALGILLACLLPLLLCGYLLRTLASDPASDELATVLTYELIAAEPFEIVNSAPAAPELDCPSHSSLTQNGE